MTHALDEPQTDLSTPPKTASQGETLPTYDLVVIGGGDALAIAEEAARLGGRVALALDTRHLTASDPDAAVRRAMIRAKHRDAAREVFAQTITLRGKTTSWGERIVALGEQVEVLDGHTVFTGRDRCAVHGREIRFQKAILAPALRPESPAIAGLDSIAYFTPADWRDLQSVPHRVAIVGRGAIACEFAQAFARAGCETHLICVGGRLLGDFESQAVRLVEEALVRDGVRIHADSAQVEAEAVGRMKALTLTGESAQRKVFVDEVIVAPEYAPSVDRMALPIAGVEVAAGRPNVDPRLRTTNPRIYALVGNALDEAGRARFGSICLRNAVLSGGLQVSADLAPRAVLTDPQMVSLGQREAPEANTFRASDCELTEVADSAHPAWAVVRTHPVSGRVVGATLAGEHVAEMATSLALAIERRFSPRAFATLPMVECTGSRLLRHIGRTYVERRALAAESRSWLGRRSA